MSWWPLWTRTSCHFDLWCDMITSLVYLVKICYKVPFTLKDEQRFSKNILLGHQKQICKILRNMVNVKCLVWFCIASLCYSRSFLVTENQNVLLEISVSSFSLLLFAWCVACDALVFVWCVTDLDLDLLGIFALTPSSIWLPLPFS